MARHNRPKVVRVSVVIASLFILLSASSGAVFAQSQEQFQNTVKAAREAYSAGNYAKAETDYKAAWAMIEKNTDPLSSINKTMLLSSLGTVYTAQRKYVEAEASYKQSLDLQDKLLQGHHAMCAETLHSYASLLRKLKRTDEAEHTDRKAEVLNMTRISVQPSLESHYDTGNLPAVSGTGSSGAANSFASTAAQNKQIRRIDRLVRISDSDRGVLQNPTSDKKPVYKTEEYTDYVYPPNAIYPVPVKKTRQVLDRYENVNISDRASLSFSREIDDFANRYRLSDTAKASAHSTLVKGGSMVETDNGWLFQTTDDLNPRFWNTGVRVMIVPRFESGSTAYVLTSEDGRQEFIAERIAIR